MKVLTFSGETPSSALKNAQIKVGEDAVIIETKEIRKKSLNKPGLYEIIIGVEEQDLIKHSARQKRKVKKMPNISDGPIDGNDVVLQVSNAAKQIAQIAKVNDFPNYNSGELGTQNHKTKESEPELGELSQIRDEISKLTDKVKLIQNMFWDEKAPQREGLVIPPEFSEIYKIAKNSGMRKEHLDMIMQLTLEHMPLKMRHSSTTVKRYFQTLLRKMILVRAENPVKPPSKRAVMVVGPTGVGKTTSIAKLAARFSYLMDRRYKVGLIVLDTYRIGAVEQLMEYARMMKLGIETVVDPPEFSTALNALRYCDYIFIDTMGSSPYDREKIGKIKEFLDADVDEFKIDTMLAMPSSLKYDDLKETYEQFSVLNIDTIMFTKLDETKTFGNIFSLVYSLGVPVSYFSIGQEVPEDLIVASSDYLVDTLLNGFKDRSAK